MTSPPTPGAPGTTDGASSLLTKTVQFGSVFAILGIAFGAFGVHLLRQNMTAEGFTVFETAVRYQMYHAFALVLTGLLGHTTHASTRALRSAFRFFVTGILLFSGSLYILAFTSISWVGTITPIGGLAFFAGWVAILSSVAPTRKTDNR